MIAGYTMLPDVIADTASRPTVSVTYLRGVLDFAVSRGAVRGSLLLRTGLDERDLIVDDARLPVDTMIAVMRAAAELCDDKAFALKLGDHVPCEELSISTPVAQAATTIAEAIALLNRYARLGIDFPALGTGDRFRMAQNAQGVWLHDLRPRDSWPELTEAVFARMARGTRRVAARDVLRAVYVTHSMRADRAAYDAIFRVPVHFESPCNALLLDHGYLDIILTPAPKHVTRILTAHADARLSALDVQRTTRGQVEIAVRSLLVSGGVNVTRVGQMLAMSRQTLYRRLKLEGTTFEAVLEQVRLTVATELLAQRGLTVREVAHRTGFSHPEAFSRAFKRWTGRSPRAEEAGVRPMGR